jgi:hypothetical protein
LVPFVLVCNLTIIYSILFNFKLKLNNNVLLCVNSVFYNALKKKMYVL